MTARHTRMVRRLLVLVLAFVAGSLGSRAAYACSCAPPPPVSDTAETAELVFDGEVVRRLADGEYEIRVATVYRGSLPESSRCVPGASGLRAAARSTPGRSPTRAIAN